MQSTLSSATSFLVQKVQLNFLLANKLYQSKMNTSKLVAVAISSAIKWLASFSMVQSQAVKTGRCLSNLVE